MSPVKVALVALVAVTTAFTPAVMPTTRHQHRPSRMPMSMGKVSALTPSRLDSVPYAVSQVWRFLSRCLRCPHRPGRQTPREIPYACCPRRGASTSPTSQAARPSPCTLRPSQSFAFSLVLRCVLLVRRSRHPPRRSQRCEACSSRRPKQTATHSGSWYRSWPSILEGLCSRRAEPRSRR